MGVQGLWTLITPVARPIKLETMGNKKLAIDSSIWLYQFQNAMRDREGRGLTNAHILGFLRRISKLLYYGIKPVFVFDGGAPVLKKQTINERKKRKQGGQENLAKTAEKLLAAQLRQAAVVQAQRRAAAQDSGDQITTNSVYFNDNLARDFAEKNTIPSKGKRRSSLTSPLKESPIKPKYVPKDQYQLPPITRRTPPREADHRLATEDELTQFIDQMKPEDLDINSPHFQSLSTEMKYEIIGDLRVKSRQQNHARVEAMKLKSDQDFSQVQILNLKQRNELTQKLLTVTDMVGKANLTIPVKIAAQRNKEYVLVKAQDGWVLGMSKDDGNNQKSPVKIDMDSDDDEDFVEVTDYAEPYTLRDMSKSQAAEDSDDAEFEEVTIPSTKGKEPLRSRDHMTEAIRYHYGAQSTARPKSPKHPRSIHTGAQLFNADEEDEDLNQAIIQSLAQVSAFESQTSPHLIDREGTSSSTVENRHLRRTDLGEGSSKSHGNTPVDQFKAQGRTQNHTLTASEPVEADLEIDDDFAMFLEPENPSESRTSAVPQTSEDCQNDKAVVVDDLSSTSSKDHLIISNPENDRSHAKQPTHHASQSNGIEEPQPSNDLELDDDFADFQNQPKLSPDVNVQNSMNLPGLPPSEDCRTSSSTTPSPVDVFPTPVSKGENTTPIIQSSTSPHPNDSQTRVKEPITSDLTSTKTYSPLPNFFNLLADHNGPVLEPKMDTIAIDAHATTSTAISASEPKSLPELNASTDTSHLQAEGNHMDLTESLSFHRLVDTPSVPHAVVEANDKSTPIPTPNNMVASQSLSQESQRTKTRIPTPPPQSLNSNQLANAGNRNVTNDDTSDEEPIPWSRSPTPVARPQSKAKQPAHVDVVSDPEDDDLNVALEAEERELAHNLESESNQWTKFLSELQDAERLDDMRHQVDAEVNKLKDQRVKDRRDADDVNLQMSKDIQSMLRLFGIPYVISPMEAEAQCAELLKKGLVDGIITDDSDVFLFGGTRVYKNMFNQNKFVECYLMNDLEKELGLSRQRLIQLAYLLGSDYTEGLAGVGPVTAMEILSEFDDEHLTVAGLDSLINFKRWWMKVQVGKDSEKESGTAFRKKFRKKKDKIWLEDSWPNPAVAEAYHKPTVDTSDQRFTWGFPDLDGLRQFLSDHLSWPSSKTDDVILPLIKRQTQRINGVEHTQGVLDSFFDYSLTNGATSYAPPPKIVSGFQSQKLQTIVQNWRKKQKEKQDSNQNETVLDVPVPTAAQNQSTNSRSKGKKKASTTQSSRKKPKNNTTSTSESIPSKQPRKRAIRAKRAIVDQELDVQPVEGTSKHFAGSSKETPAQPVIKRPVRATRAQRTRSSDDDEFRIETSSADEWMASLVE